MTQLHNLIVFQEARQLIRWVKSLSEAVRFGDLSNQIRRAAISVASNIAEGHGTRNDKQFAKYARIARASANEVHAQLLILCDLDYVNETHPAIELALVIAKRLSCLIRRLDPG